MNARTVISRLVLTVALAGGVGHAAPVAPVELIVTPAWLADRMGKDPLVVLHIGDQAEFAAGHIPGAQLITLPDVSEPGAKLNLQMASIDRLRDAFEVRGVGDDTHLVLYFGKGQVTQTARVFVALDFLGLADRTSILDGGLPAWRAGGHVVSTEASTATRRSLTPHPRPEVIVSADWVKAHLTDPSVKIIDARAPEYYAGEESGSRYPRPGHIAGAGSVPFTTLNTDAPALLLKSVAELRALFEAAGAKPGAEVVTYCHIGQQGSQAYLAARLLGYRVHLYDGSFEEWSALPDYPVVKGRPGGR